MVNVFRGPGTFGRGFLMISFVNLCVRASLGSSTDREITEGQVLPIFYIDSSFISYEIPENSIKSLINSFDFSRNPEETKDCSEISSKLNTSSGSVLLLSLDEDIQFTSVKCLSGAGVSRIIQVSKEELLRKSQFSGVIQEFVLKFFSQKSICQSGSFDLRLMSCLRKPQRQLTDLSATYQGYRQSSFSIPESVTKMKTEQITVEFFAFLVQELQSYAGGFSCSGTKISATDYTILHTAISDLFETGLKLPLVIDKTKLDDLFQVTSTSLCTDNFTNYLSSGIELVKPAVYYLESYNRSDTSYPSAIKNTFDYFISFIKSVYPSDPGLTSSNIVLAYTYSTNSDSITLEFNFKTIVTDCTCSYCSSSVQLLEINSLYKGLGFASDVYAYKILKAGTISGNTVTYLSTPEEVTETDCFTFSKVLVTTGTTDTNFKCYVDSLNKLKACSSIVYNKPLKELTITFKNSGIFAPIRDCDPVSGYSSAFECCSTNCLCYSKTTCDACQTGWAYQENSCNTCSYEFVNGNSGLCSECSYQFEDSQEKRCSICSSGYDSEEGSAVKCSLCAQGFKRNTNTQRCDECAVGWKNDQKGTPCAVCSLGFEASENGDPCAKCSTGYKSSSTDLVTCDLCEEGYGRALDGSCGKCGNNCLCTVAAGCKSCVSGYFYKSSSLTDDNLGSCTAGDHYVKASHIVSKYFDPNLAYISLTLSYKIDVVVTGADCAAYFVNYGILGTNAYCSIKDFKTLLISLGNDFTITPLTALELTEGFLLETTEKSPSSISILVDYSVNPKLTALIAGPSKVTKTCSTTTFVYSGSNSHGPQKLSLSYSWEVVNSPAGVTLSSLTSEQVTVTLSSSSPSLFTLKLTVSNNLKMNDDVNLEVTVQDSQKLIFSLDAGSGTVFKRSSDISVSRVNSELCGCSTSLTSKWTIGPNPVPGVVLDTSRLRIPQKTLNYGFNTISLDLECGKLIGSASITIEIVYSDLVLIVTKSDQDISPLIDLMIDGSNSYDPDGTSLSYSWNYGSGIFTTPSITVPKSVFEYSESLSVTFTISATLARTASQTLKFKIIAQNPLKVSILGPRTKVSSSSQVVIRAAASSESTSGAISYEWSQISGILVMFYSSSMALWLSPGTLEGGTAFTFEYKAIQGPFSVSATSSFSVNKGAKCESVSVSPATATKGTKISVKALGCADLDNSDYPLVLKLSIKRTTRYSLILTSYSSVLTGLTFPSGTTSVLVEVCDGLSDCWADATNQVTLNRLLRQEQSNLVDIYTELKDEYGTIYAILFMLTDRVDDQIIRIMWNDFTDEVKAGSCSDKEKVDVVLDLLDEKQDVSIAKRNLRSYIELLSNSLSSRPDGQVIRELETLAIRVSEIDKSSNGLTLSLILLQKVINHKSFDGLYYNRIVSKFELFIIEDVFSQIDQINKLSLKFDLSQTGFKKNDIVQVEIVSKLSEDKDSMFSVNAYSSLYSESGEFFTNDPVSVLSGSGCKVSAKDENWKLKKCFKLESGEWKSLNCEKSLVVNQNGIYRVQYSSNQESNIYNLGPELYTIISLFSIFVICAPFFKFFDRNAKVHPSSDKVTVKTGDLSSRIQTEYDYEELRISIYSKHLFFSLFTSSVNLSRIMKLLMFLTVVIFMISMQVVLLGYAGLDKISTGFVSSFLSLPVSTCLIFGFKGSANQFKWKVSAGLAIVLQLCCGTSVFFLKSSTGWVISFIIALATEVILTESLLMAVRLRFKF